MKSKTFNKEERLCSKRSIEDLFRNGSSFILYPYRVVFQRQDVAEQVVRRFPIQVLVSVSKRKIRSAVQRNLIKRLLREAYRHLKAEHLYSFFEENEGLPSRIQVHLAIQYLPSETLEYSYLLQRMELLMKKLQSEYVDVHLGNAH